ncbi:ABC transporter permease [Mucilaginibacter sp. L3T2-6]|uniref:ABC transporter permease n=1 Tax=Mucilaginibacter sp. L3T2-6 TaxID=3062491 RepID=UPI002676345E|nr:ABC transporter permease [Mucilaginibacter sp. L3T2-6]MDO3644963.1 ABC transporter permease [Mucilaginibacter sp. L3T2-6]MDV6217411.1 ABC transporter permease [Mucilaginibacter sp. L3T2-6]
MLRNYLKITWRNLLKHKAFSFINIIGLAIGMASSALILLWINNELSFDRFHKNEDRLYTVYNRSVFDGKLWCWNTTPKVMGKTLKKEYSQFEQVARVTWNNTFLFTVGEKRLNISGNCTDPDFLTMFSFPLIKGNPKTALNEVHDIVITEKMSKKLFGDADPMGKTIKVDSNAYFTVTGLMKDLPPNTRFKFEYLMPWEYLKKIKQDDDYWGNNSIQTYVMLRKGVTEAQANAAILHVTKDHSDTKDIDQFIHPIAKWHLYSKPENGKLVGGAIEKVKIFSIIAAFILLIACINFMNLSTARSEKRAREVGIRKVVGALRNSLISQFLGESILIALISGIIALVIVQLSLPAYDKLVDAQLTVPYSNPVFWAFFLGFIILTGVISGSYPALYLSSFKPVSVLKGTFKAANALVTPRKVLVVVQFLFATVLIICTIIIREQLQYAQDRDTGYKKDNLVYVFMTGNVEKNYEAIKNDLISGGAAAAVTKTSAPITEGWSDSWGFMWKGAPPKNKIDFNIFNTDGDLVKTMGLKIIQGRDIDPKIYPTDSTAILLNEASVKIMGLKDPVGEIVTNGEGKDARQLHVVGVVKDFILQSPYEPVKHMIIQGPKSWFNVIHFRMNNAHTTADNLKRAEAVFKRYNPDYPFEYNFVDQAYAQKFGAEQRIGTLASLFAGLTIVISCLGLFGLAAYMAQNRLREIGIRKVLGASVMGVTTMLSKDFLILVMISFAIAAPISWYSMHKWLSNYSYRVPISIWVFVMTAAITVLIAIATVSFQAIKAALTNPVKSLRGE